MIRLNSKQVDDKVKFIGEYIQASNAAEGSKLDANANVSAKNIATLSAELHKDATIQVNRKLVYNKIVEAFGENTANEYIRQLEEHEIYAHDESSIMPYCVSISMYPFILNGLQGFGGDSKAPKHLSSYNGGFVNLVFAVASQFAGAVATVEYLLYFDYFARRDYGDNYLEDNLEIITQELQQVVYALNQPAAARGFQSVFWNISVFDKQYFDAMFDNFVFPDYTKPNWETYDKLQKYFMKWFNKERTKAVLTFPVVTAACLNDGKTLIDTEFKEFIAQELSEGNAFFIFTSPNAYALSSCCRLKNDISDSMNDFSYSLGAGGIMTGSINVITINMNRLIQNWAKKHKEFYPDSDLKTQRVPLIAYLLNEIDKVHKYQVSVKRLYKEYLTQKMLPVYDNGFINMDKQYLTLGINGLLEGAEYLGYTPDNNEEYKEFISNILQTFSLRNQRASAMYDTKFNTEFVPAENLGVKFATWDKKDKYSVPRDCYNSYLYRVEDNNISILDKFALHGRDTSRFLDGGSAVHSNLENYPTKEAFIKLLDVAVVEGCEYFCFNVKVTICEDCNTIDKRTVNVCSKCGSTNVSHATRVIGYLKKIKDFSPARQNEEHLRNYHKEGILVDVKI